MRRRSSSTTVNTTRLAQFVVAALVVSIFQFISPVSSISASANTALAVEGFCRSSDGSGALEDAGTTSNGSYISLASRTSDSVTGLKITPVFSKKMYVDLSKNFDATYIAYQIENTSGSAITNAQIVLSGFEGTALGPVTENDLKATVSLSAANNSKATAYFMIRAKAVTNENQLHQVRVFSVDGQQLAGCQTNIQGIQRSLSASSNKVTGISVSTTSPTLDQTFTVTVQGEPGRIGSGASPDLSVMAFSPASNASWPTKAIRLESVSFVLRGFNGNSTAGACELTGATFASRTATWTNTLVVRNLSTCATTNKHTYVATYTFRLVGLAPVNPVIRPLSSIASGTQIKYTGSLPSVAVSIALTDAVTPTITKGFVSCTPLPADVRVRYAVTVSVPSGTSKIDILRDQPAPGGQFVAATFRDVNNTSVGGTAITKQDVNISGVDYWDFKIPDKFTASNTTDVVLTYDVDYPNPAETTGYTNRAFGLYGDLVVASGDIVTGIRTDISSGGDCVVSFDNTEKDKSPQSITFDPPAAVGSLSTTNLQAYSDSSLPVTLKSLTPEVCTITLFGGSYSLFAQEEGQDCEVEASQSGDAVFSKATEVVRTIAVLKGQVISSTSGIFGAGSTTTVEVVATSKLKVSLTSIDTAVCTVNPTEAIPYSSETGRTTYTITKGSATGSCILSAAQPGDQIIWGPAPSKDIIIGVGEPQLIVISSPAEGASFESSTASFTISATARRQSDNTNAFLPVYFSSNSQAVCALSVSSGTEANSGYTSSSGVTSVEITITGPGSCQIAANQDGLKDDGTQSGFASAEQVFRNLSITGTGLTEQFLEIEDPGAKTYGASDFNITSISKKVSDGLATGLVVDLETTTPAHCQLGNSSLVNGQTITAIRLLQAGQCELVAKQAGDNTYKIASAATRTIEVSIKQVSVTGLSVDKVYDASDSATIQGSPRLSGLVVGDGNAEIQLSGSPSGSFADALAGENKTVPVSGFTLTGTKASSYELVALSLTGTISKRPLTIKFTDVSLNRDDTPSCSVEDVSIVSGSLTEAAELLEIACSDFPVRTEGSMANGNYPITPSSAVITLATADPSDVTVNYQISYQSGTLTVSGKTVPTLEATETTVVYGSALDLEDETESGESGKGVKAKHGGQFLKGKLSYKLPNGSAVSNDLSAGSYNLTVIFTPDSDIEEEYESTQTTRKVTVKPRRLTLSGVSAINKLYDGSTSASVAGTVGIIADPATEEKTLAMGYGLGILAGDTVSVILSGTPSIAFNSADAGTSIAVSYDGLTLSGSKASNYVLRSQLTLSANITKRKLTIDLPSYEKVYDGELSLATGSASLVALPEEEGGDGAGVVPEDAVELDASQDLTAAFLSASVGEGKAIALSGGGLSGAKAGNYELVARNSITGTILPRKLTLTGLSPQNKVYDGTRSAVVAESNVELSALSAEEGGNVSCDVTEPDCGVIANDSGAVSLSGVSVFEFESANVGQSVAIGFSGRSLTGEKSANYELVAPRSLSANIVKRRITVELASLEKIYDGNKSLITTGKTLTVLPESEEGNVSGEDQVAIIEGDDVELDPNNSLVAEFPSANVGDNLSVSMSGAALRGGDKGNYDLRFRSELKGKIVPRPIGFKANSASMLVGESVPTLSFSLLQRTGTETGFAPGEDASSLGGVSLIREAGSSPGRYEISLSVLEPGTSLGRDNYDIELEFDYLYIAGANIQVQDLDPDTGLRPVVCDCVGFKPGSEVVLTMYSTPTELSQATVEEDGTCPLLKGAIPADTTGDHTLEISGSFPNDEELIYLVPFTSGGGGSGGGGGGGIDGYTITLNYPKGQTGPSQLFFKIGDSKLKLPILSKKGFVFRGWNLDITTRKGMKVLRNVTEPMNLYPVWRLLPKKSTFYFGPDSKALTPDTRARLTKLAKRMARQPQAALMVVDGWVKRTSDTSYSRALSNARARNVARYLRQRGATVALSFIEPKGVHPRVNDRARKAEVRVFFSGAFKVATSQFLTFR